MSNTFSSTIIPTIARPTLERAVCSVLEQDFNAAGFEVIVVNDSGKPLPPAPWQADPRVTVINTNRRERIFARNAGAAAAKGEYLNFLDDDDWLLPGVIEKFWKFSQRCQADWLYGSTQLVDRQGQPLIQLHHGLNGNCFVQTMAGEWIPMQSSFIRAQAFFAIGGFTALIFATQDVDLTRRIALHGDLAELPEVVACIGMGQEASSTDKGRASLYSRNAREKILNEPGVFQRMQQSAQDAQWKGRMVRIYLTSAVWNLQRGKVFTGFSRLVFGIGSLVLAGFGLLSPEFWQALLRNYESPTFQRGQQAIRSQRGAGG